MEKIINYTNGGDLVLIEKEAATYNLLGGGDYIKLNPYYITWSGLTVDYSGWESAKINGGDGIDTLWLNQTLTLIGVDTLAELGEPVDGWTPLTNTMDGHVYTAEIKNIEIFKGVSDFIGNSENNHVVSTHYTFDISLDGRGGDDLLVVRNDYDYRFFQTITVNGGTGDDVINIHSANKHVTLNLEGGEGFDTIILGEEMSPERAQCRPSAKIYLDGDDSITGFEKFIFVDNEPKIVRITNDFLLNMETDFLEMEGDWNTRIMFTDHIERVDLDIEIQCRDGYAHYQLEIPPEASSVAMASTDTVLEAPVFMDIWVSLDMWVYN